MEGIIVLGVYLLAIALFLNFFYRPNYRDYKFNYRIKYIDFKKNTPTLIEQLRKVDEEDKEFSNAVIKNDIENALEEFHDSIQAKANALQIMGVPMVLIEESYEQHILKLQLRGWEFKR